VITWNRKSLIIERDRNVHQFITRKTKDWRRKSTLTECRMQYRKAEVSWPGHRR